MQNLKSVDDSTQVGCEDINMSSRRERKGLTNCLCEVLQKVYEDEDIELMSNFEDDHYESDVIYSEEDNEEWQRAKALPTKVKSDFEDDYYDSEVVYSEKVDEDEEYWKERSFEDLQELINDSENTYERDNEEWRRAKALSAKVQIFSYNKMENKRSVDDSTQVGCEDKRSSRREEEEEEKYTEMKNEMSFYLDEDPTYEISAVGTWRENSHGEVVGDADTYFLHILTGQRCESAQECLDGWSEQDEEAEEKWETLSKRIEELDGLEQIICDEESFGI